MRRSLAVLALGAGVLFAAIGCSTVVPTPSSSPASLIPLRTPSASLPPVTPGPTPPTTPLAWQPTGPIPIARVDHSATLLADGRVLVVGGRHLSFEINATAEDETLDSAVIFDPATGTWHAAAPLHEARYDHVAVLLSDGRVLVVGGFTAQPRDPVAHSIETYDPLKDAWTRQAMPMKGAVESATLLSGGRVLVIAMLGPAATIATRDHQAFAILEPATMTWTAVRATDAIVGGHAAVRLPDGRVLAAGGFDVVGDGPPPAEDLAAVFDPTTGRWTRVDPMHDERLGFAMALLSDGRVLAAGNGTAEVFDPATGDWATTGSPAGPWLEATGVALPDGRYLLVGEQGTSSSRHVAELYDPSTGSWRDAGAFPTTGSLTATLLSDGRVLVTGGLVTCFAGTGCHNDALTDHSYLVDPSAIP